MKIQIKEFCIGRLPNNDIATTRKQEFQDNAGLCNTGSSRPPKFQSCYRASSHCRELKRNGYQVIFHDLYAAQFDSILPADEIPEGVPLPEELDLHCKEISNADGIIIVHPNWWGQPPAISKRWLDRVFRPGVAYQFLEGDMGEGIPVGLPKAKAALVFNTSNTPTERGTKVFGDPLELLWKDCIFGLCGVGNFYREMFNVIVTSTLKQRQKWLAKVQEVVGRYFPDCR